MALAIFYCAKVASCQFFVRNVTMSLMLNHPMELWLNITQMSQSNHKHAQCLLLGAMVARNIGSLSNSTAPPISSVLSVCHGLYAGGGVGAFFHSSGCSLFMIHSLFLWFVWLSRDVTVAPNTKVGIRLIRGTTGRGKTDLGFKCGNVLPMWDWDQKWRL